MRRLSLIALVAASAVIGACYASAFLPGGAPSWIGWPYMLAASVSLVAAMVLGAARDGRSLGALRWAFAFTFVVLVGSFALALLQPAPVAGAPLWLGLPHGAAAVLYGVGVLPMLVLPLTYAVTFDSHTLSGDDLARLREAARAAQAARRAEEVA